MRFLEKNAKKGDFLKKNFFSKFHKSEAKNFFPPIFLVLL